MKRQISLGPQENLMDVVQEGPKSRCRICTDRAAAYGNGVCDRAGESKRVDGLEGFVYTPTVRMGWQLLRTAHIEERKGVRRRSM